ncbi:MAG: MFS transporter, partial [Chloroflexota bacterium]
KEKRGEETGSFHHVSRKGEGDLANPNLRLMVLILGLMLFWVQGDNYAASPLIVQIAKDFNLSIGQAALSITSYMLPFGLFTLIFGPLADRFGKAKVINTAAFGTAIFSCLGAVAFNLTSLCIIRAVNGAFAAAIIPVTMSLIGDAYGHDPKAAQNALGRVFGMMFLGGACATAIAGALSFVGSWRLVYLVYGIAELILAVVMLKTIEKQPGTISRLNYVTAYRDALKNSNLIRTVGIIFLIGASVFGSFSYVGKYVSVTTGYSILIVGLILTFFGLATVWGGRYTGLWKERIGNRMLLYAGVFGCAMWATMGLWNHWAMLSLSLAGFGLAWVLIQPVLVNTAQQLMPRQKGTVMSLVSFNMFVGGGIGTLLGGYIQNNWGFGPVFVIAAVLMLVAGILGTTVLNRIILFHPDSTLEKGG